MCSGLLNLCVRVYNVCEVCVLKISWIYMYIFTAQLRWDGSHSAEVNENINLGYSHDQGYS